jgi:pyruvate ferredoxin oxidoreductase alpha subunit
MSASIGACAAGARTMTGTSSQGFALMWEMLYIAAGLRLPIVMAVINRALSAPINIHGDQSDTMGARDSGWIQIYSENSQEAYDNMIQSVRIAEKLKLPTLVTTDGFIISHCMEVVEVQSDEDVKKFVGEYKPERYLLDIKKPFTLGAIDLQDYYFEHRYQLADAMNNAIPAILEVAKDFEKAFGRKYDLFEKYKMDDAEIAIVVIGSAAGTAKVVVDELREKGVKAGLVKIRVFRPFPHAQLADALKNVKAVAVMDRADACAGSYGPLYNEAVASIYSHLGANAPKTMNFIYGLGGRDITLDHFQEVFAKLEKVKAGEKPAKVVEYINVRID